MEQRSDEWFAKKLAKITGTRAADLMGTAATRKTLMAKLLRERATAVTNIIRQTADMKRGEDLEPEAIQVYSIQQNVNVEPGGYVERGAIAAVSPDGLIGSDGGVEVKCLKEENHIKIMLDDNIDKRHYWQIMWGMYVTGRKWWDYFGYCPELPPPLTTYTKRFEITIEVFEEIDKRLNDFVEKYNLICERVGLTI